MKYYEALQMTDKLNIKLHADPIDPGHASIVRILPNDVDPPVNGDNGWDVEVTLD